MQERLKRMTGDAMAVSYSAAALQAACCTWPGWGGGGGGALILHTMGRRTMSCCTTIGGCTSLCACINTRKEMQSQNTQAGVPKGIQRMWRRGHDEQRWEGYSMQTTTLHAAAGCPPVEEGGMLRCAGVTCQNVTRVCTLQNKRE